MGGKIVFIIVAIFAIGVIVYLVSSGALVGGLKTFNALFPTPTGTGLFAAGAPASSTGSSSGSGGGWASFWSFLGPGGGFHGNLPTIGGGSSSGTYFSQAPSGGSSGSGFGGSATTTINPADIPAGFTASQLSPYFHQVRFGGISAGTSYYYGTITLYDNSYNTSGTIDVTGWEIKALRGGEYIPKAINVYDPSGLTPPSDIVLRPGDTVYLYSSSAPFNLRLNECIGYIANVAKFQPALPMNCPSVTDRSAIENFTGACQNYILSLGGCQQPNMASPQIPRTDYACQDYLESHFTYKSCFQDHAGDANFLSNQVWVWTGSNVVDQYHDTVELLDRNGKLVDIYSY